MPLSEPDSTIPVTAPRKNTNTGKSNENIHGGENTFVDHPSVPSARGYAGQYNINKTDERKYRRVQKDTEQKQNENLQHESARPRAGCAVQWGQTQQHGQKERRKAFERPVSEIANTQHSRLIHGEHMRTSPLVPQFSIFLHSLQVKTFSRASFDSLQNLLGLQRSPDRIRQSWAVGCATRGP